MINISCVFNNSIEKSNNIILPERGLPHILFCGGEGVIMSVSCLGRTGRASGTPNSLSNEFSDKVQNE